MATTPNLQIDHVATSQNNKETTLNTGFDDFDGAIAGHASLAMSDADLTVPTTIALYNMALFFTGALSTGRVVTMPAHPKLYVVVNLTGGSPAAHDLTIKVGAGTKTVVLSDDNAHLIYSDGANSVFQVS